MPSRLRAIQQALLEWYRHNGRPLLWRRMPATPYTVLVREVMLQQTQAHRVEQALPVFLQRFPDLEALASAPLAEVLRAWEGLGYYTRARALWACARTILYEHGGHIPQEETLLRRLPGIGPYTAAAILVFAFGRQDVPLLDTNIRRVLLRLVDYAANPPARQLRALAQRWIPRGASAQWHEALMDLGALLCRARTPLCPQCPLRQYCRSAGKGDLPAAPDCASNEPSFGGLPRRLWRGRLLRLLLHNSPIPVEEAAAMLFSAPTPSPLQRRYFEELLATLERDGLLERRNGLLQLPNAL